MNNIKAEKWTLPDFVGAPVFANVVAGDIAVRGQFPW